MTDIALMLSSEDVISLKLAASCAIEKIEDQIGRDEVVKAHVSSHVSRLLRLRSILNGVQLGNSHETVKWL